LGSDGLFVGSNGLSTTVSGLIADGNFVGGGGSVLAPALYLAKRSAIHLPSLGGSMTGGLSDAVAVGATTLSVPRGSGA
jgi:hypothetical protein